MTIQPMNEQNVNIFLFWVFIIHAQQQEQQLQAQPETETMEKSFFLVSAYAVLIICLFGTSIFSVLSPSSDLSFPLSFSRSFFFFICLRFLGTYFCNAYNYGRCSHLIYG